MNSNKTNFPRPTRRAVRAIVELTINGVNASATSAARALETANEDYIDLVGLQQEGSRISRAAWDAVNARHAYATRLQDTCDTLIAIADC